VIDLVDYLRDKLEHADGMVCSCGRLVHTHFLYGTERHGGGCLACEHEDAGAPARECWLHGRPDSQPLTWHGIINGVYNHGADCPECYKYGRHIMYPPPEKRRRWWPWQRA
jgi:hypothetical protein